MPSVQAEVEVVTIPPAQSASTSGVLQLSIDDLKQACDGFHPSKQIGKGGFGEVYRGYFRSTSIAIKLLTDEGVFSVARGASPTDVSASTSSCGAFIAEVKALTKFPHRNLVELMGYCATPPALVYEFMENGSLHSYLHGKAAGTLTWTQRGRILKDSCRGLAWLHGSKPPLIHQDVKLANILLDKCFNAKLGDFGFSVELPRVVGDRTLLKARTFVRTEGYYPPELSEGLYSPKSDVYSYGVVVLETYTGQKAYSTHREDRRLVDRFQDSIGALSQFKKAFDTKAGKCAPYLQQLLHTIVVHSITKHSKRACSEKVMDMWKSTNF